MNQAARAAAATSALAREGGWAGAWGMLSLEGGVGWGMLTQTGAGRPSSLGSIGHVPLSPPPPPNPSRAENGGLAPAGGTEGLAGDRTSADTAQELSPAPGHSGRRLHPPLGLDPSTLASAQRCRETLLIPEPASAAAPPRPPHPRFPRALRDEEPPPRNLSELFKRLGDFLVPSPGLGSLTSGAPGPVPDPLPSLPLPAPRSLGDPSLPHSFLPNSQETAPERR